MKMKPIGLYFWFLHTILWSPFDSFWYVCDVEAIAAGRLDGRLDVAYVRPEAYIIRDALVTQLVPRNTESGS